MSLAEAWAWFTTSVTTERGLIVFLAFLVVVPLMFKAFAEVKSNAMSANAHQGASDAIATQTDVTEATADAHADCLKMLNQLQKDRADDLSGQMLWRDTHEREARARYDKLNERLYQVTERLGSMGAALDECRRLHGLATQQPSNVTVQVGAHS